jgi:hypothetical protein
MERVNDSDEVGYPAGKVLKGNHDVPHPAWRGLIVVIS